MTEPLADSSSDSIDSIWRSRLPMMEPSWAGSLSPSFTGDLTTESRKRWPIPDAILLRHEGRSAVRGAEQPSRSLVINASSVEPLLPLPRPVAPGRRDDPW
jgi:hypothetical protein